MLLPLWSGGDASLDEGMSTAWSRLEVREILLAQRHQMVRQTDDIGSPTTFRAKYDNASGRNTIKAEPGQV